MINKESQQTIKKGLKKEAMSLSDMKRQLQIPICNIRITIAYLLGAGEIEEKIYGRSKVYSLNKNGK